MAQATGKVTRNWKRWMAVSCSHGTHLCPDAERAVLKFAADYKPHFKAHLGDFVDTEALRKGGTGGESKNEDIGDDFDAGIDFLRKFEPSLICMGNHEHRAFDLMNHKNEMVAKCAGDLVRQFDEIARELKAETLPYNILTGWYRLGDAHLGHGYMFNEQAIRDHAEMRGGKTIIGHLHRVGEAPTRNLDRGTGYCVGWLGRIEEAHYALRRRATCMWRNGFAYGEYCDSETTVNLVRKTDTCGWRLP